MATTRVLYTRISEDVHDAITDLSATTGRSITSIVTELLGRQLGIAADPSRILTSAIQRQKAHRTPGIGGA